MRILQISSARSFGGGERHVAALTNALAERGHEIHAALAPSSPLYDELKSLPTDRVIETRLRNALDISSASRIARIIRERNIEIVHAHLGRDYPLASLAVRRSPSARLIITRHVLFRLSRIHAIVLSNVARVIAVSEAVGRSLKAQRIFTASKIRVVRNGIDIQHFENARQKGGANELLRRLSIDGTRRLVGTIGQLKKQKGQEEFLRAASIVARTAHNVNFIIAGEDASPSGENRKALESLTVKLGLRDRVHLLGRIEDIATLFCAMNIFVSPSRNESFGLVLAESMACGTPVVATATGGAREIIEDNVNGRLVPVGDVDALARAINDLVASPEDQERFRLRASGIVRERYSLERMVNETEKLYFEALRT